MFPTLILQIVIQFCGHFVRAHVFNSLVKFFETVRDWLLGMNGLDSLPQLVPGLLTVVLRKLWFGWREQQYDSSWENLHKNFSTATHKPRLITFVVTKLIILPYSSYIPRHWGHSMHGRVPLVSWSITILYSVVIRIHCSTPLTPPPFPWLDTYQKLVARQQNTPHNRTNNCTVHAISR